VKILIGFSNRGSQDFIVESMDAAFRYPQDYSFYIQNVCTGTMSVCLIWVSGAIRIWPVPFPGWNIKRQPNLALHTHSHFTALLEFVWDHSGEQVPER